MADVANTLNTWSATPAANLPNDNTTIGGGLADNLQEIQAVVRRDLASRAIPFTAASTVDLSLSGGPFIAVVHDAGSVAISSFGSLTPGMWRIVTFYVASGTLTITHSSAILLPGFVDITVVNGDSMLVESIGTGIWQCHFYHPTSNPQLRAIAPLASSANTFPYFTGAGTAALAPLSPFVRTLLDDTDSATFLNTAGAVKKTGDTMSGILAVQVNGQTGFATAGLRSESTAGNAGISLHAASEAIGCIYLEHVSGGDGFRVLNAVGTHAKVEAHQVSILRPKGGCVSRRQTSSGLRPPHESAHIRIRASRFDLVGSTCLRDVAGVVEFVNTAESAHVTTRAAAYRSGGASAVASGFQVASGADIGTLYASAFSSTTLSGEPQRRDSDREYASGSWRRSVLNLQCSPGRPR